MLPDTRATDGIGARLSLHAVIVRIGKEVA
jgi:hypothetical protein